ncbi:MAG: sulfatase [Planctomycetota bacterium]
MHVAVAGGVLCSLLFQACDDATSPSPAARAPTEVDARGGRLRLIDALEVAEIDSPLLDTPATASLEELTEAPRKVVLAEGFERPSRGRRGWPRHPWARVERTEGQAAFRVQKEPLELRRYLRQGYGWFLPVQPDAHYVLSRRVRTDMPLSLDFSALELRRPITKIAQNAGNQNAGNQNAKPRAAPRHGLNAHWPTPPEPDGTWQTGSVSFQTTPSTRSIALFLRPVQAGPDSAATTHDLWFDDVRLEQVMPKPEQMISLVKARALADGADPTLGIAKRGQFPPVGDPDKATREDRHNYSLRDALYAPPPTDLVFPLRLGENPSLRFSVSLSRESAAGEAARFEILVDGVELWARELATGPGRWRWFDERVDLSSYAGESVRLTLRTRATQGRPHPMWGNPTIDTPFVGSGPRNVILIAVDTLRADALSCYGHAERTSPNIDALAADGVRFAQAVANANWTCPSFASIFTGLVPSTHRVFSSGPSSPLPRGFQTLAERFRAEDWATHAIAYKAPLYHGGFDQGFEVSLNVPRRRPRASENLADALQWLENNASRRNFLFLHFDDPHQPFTQPRPFDRMFGGAPDLHGVKLPHSVRPQPQQMLRYRDLMRSLYEGEVAYVDARIGAFLDELKRRGLYDASVIAFVSDHGEELWDHGSFGHGERLLYDEVVRVPLILKPAVGPYARGKTVDTQVMAFDLMPTLLDLAGIPFEADLDAESLLDSLGSQPRPDPPPPRMAIIECSQPAIALRAPPWKYILRHTSLPIREELFALDVDPGERQNVAARHPEQLRELRLRVLDYIMRHRTGRYVVAVGDPAVASETSVGGLASAQPLFGASIEPAGDGTLRFRGWPGESLIAVAQIDTDAALRMAGEGPHPETPRRYERGALEELVRARRPAIAIFDGPPRTVGTPSPQQSVDLRHLRALEALGYVGDPAAVHHR